MTVYDEVEKKFNYCFTKSSHLEDMGLACLIPLWTHSSTWKWNIPYREDTGVVEIKFATCISHTDNKERIKIKIFPSNM